MNLDHLETVGAATVLTKQEGHAVDHVQRSMDDFARNVEITRDVRFQANLRLARRQRSSSYCVSLLSLYVIGLSLIPNIISLAAYQSQLLLACSIILSVFVIFTSIIDGSQNFFHQGELLHECARKVAFISYELKNIDVRQSPDDAMQKLTRPQERYRLALDDCPTNHDNADYYKEVSNKPHLFPKRYSGKIKFLIKLRYTLSHVFLRTPFKTCDTEL